jgi:hypothetical protein
MSVFETCYFEGSPCRQTVMLLLPSSTGTLLSNFPAMPPQHLLLLVCF